jgi:hypothetical protein
MNDRVPASWASRLSRRSVSIAVVFFWLVLVSVTALYPCLPAQEPGGEIMALSRIDYALLSIAHPEAIWNQWTGGGEPGSYWTDRHQSVIAALLLSVVSLGIGLTVWIAAGQVLQWGEATMYCTSLVTGYCAIHVVRYPIVLSGYAPSSASILSALFLLSLFLGALGIWRRTAPVANDNTEPLDTDDFRFGWRRRLFGMTCCASLVVVALYVVGSLTPTPDNEIQIPSQRSTAEILINEFTCSDSTRSAIAPMASKGASTIVFLAASYLLWNAASRQTGLVPASLMIFLFVSTPSLVELCRLGRPEPLVAACFGGLVYWIHKPRSEGQRARGLYSMSPLLVMMLAPVIEWVVFVFLAVSHSPEPALHSLLRMGGLSPHWTIPWMGCAAVGVSVARKRHVVALTAAAAFSMVVIGIAIQRDDRFWIPLTTFVAIPVAYGLRWLLDHQPGWLGLLVWSLVLIVTCVNLFTWPTMDNRILAPISSFQSSHFVMEGRVWG